MTLKENLITMNARQLFVASVISASLSAALASAAWAGDAGSAGAQTPARAAMRAAVLQARANGELRPAGEAAEWYRAAPIGVARARADVRAEVLLARAHGELIPAGQGAPVYLPEGTSTLARAEVREEVRMARLHGELIPSGEGFGPMDPDRPAFRFRGHTLAAAKAR